VAIECAQDPMTVRVLHVVDSLWGGGAEVSMLSYLKVVGNRADTVHRAVVLRGDPPSREAAAGLPVSIAFGPSRPGIRWADARLIRSQFADFEPDLVHSVLFRSTLAAARATGPSRIPMLVTLTSVAYEIDDLASAPSMRARLGLRASHAIHGLILRGKRVSIRAVSQPVADRAVGVFRIDPEAIAVIPDLRADPRESVTAEPAELRRRLGIAEDAPVLVYMAREHPIKDHGSLLEAVALLLEDRPGLQVLLAGAPGAATRSIDQAIDGLGLEGTVIRLGHRDDVPDLLAASDVFVSSSTSEGLGASAIEAMGMGLPVVAVDNPGIREVLGETHPGLVPRGDRAGFADRVRRFLNDDSLRQSVSHNARSRFLEVFEIERNAWRLDEVSRRAVDRYPRARSRRRGRG
jgi:glycosyltransferase involved in cell wall biosynthesis